MDEHPTSTPSTLLRHPWRRLFLVPLCLLGLSGCSGLFGNGEGNTLSDDEAAALFDPPENPSVNPTRFECDPTTTPLAYPLRRPSAAQLRHSIEDLVRYAMPSRADEVLAAARSDLDALPDDSSPHIEEGILGAYKRLDQVFTQLQTDLFFDLSIKLADHMVSTSQRRDALIGTNGSTTDRINGFIRRFGRLAAKRPLRNDEITAYTTMYGNTGTVNGEALANVIAAMLLSPDFSFVLEEGEEAVEMRAGVYRLTPHAIATRLAMHFWESTPDPALLDAADNGSLGTPEGMQTQINRMMADAKFNRMIKSFVDEWMLLDRVPDYSDSSGDAFDDFRAGTSTAGLGQAMREEIVSAMHYAINQGQRFDEFFTSRLSFTDHPGLAGIYGVSPWNGEGTPPTFAQTQRKGLLSRAAHVANRSVRSRPVIKGIFVRNVLLCDKIPPPPDNAIDTMLPTSEEMTTREATEAITEAPGSSCAGCHQRFMNPLGFPSDEFDALGRHRTQERVYSDMGAFLMSLPIDTTTVPQVDPADMRPVTGTAALVDRIAESPRLGSCFSRQYFRFAHGQLEDVTRNACQLEHIREQVATSSMREVFASVAMAEAFRERTMPGAE